MATLQTRLQDLATRIATECKALRGEITSRTGNLASLTTSEKTSLVLAINELKSITDTLASSGGATINDTLETSLVQTYSITKINDKIATAVSALTNGAPEALDTLEELAAALGDDANFAATVTAALGNRVRHDVNNQGLTTQQKQNARTNIDAYGSAELGNPDANLVTVFETGLT